MVATIGIKVANGDFYSILEENSAVKKRLVLTTVHDNQKSVQIDLYKSFTKSMADALYIGSLVVEKIRPAKKGEPSIELTITSTKDGAISADSVDLDNPSKEYQHLSLHLKSFEEDKNDYADFEMEESGQGLYQKAADYEDEEKTGAPWPLIIAGIIVLAIVLFALWFFLLRKPGPAKPAENPAAPTETAAPAEPAKPAAAKPAEPAKPAAKPAEAAKPAKKPQVIKEPAKAPAAAPSRDRKNIPVYSFKVPQTIPPEGVSYKIRWGDTLWDISEAFYRNPWLYPRIVKHNSIRNPNLIVSGTAITVPPKE